MQVVVGFLGRFLLEVRLALLVLVAGAIAQGIWNYLNHPGYAWWLIAVLLVLFFVGTFFLPKGGGAMPKTSDPSARDKGAASPPGKANIGLVVSAGGGGLNPIGRTIGPFICSKCGSEVGLISEVVEKGAPVKCPVCQAIQPEG